MVSTAPPPLLRDRKLGLDELQRLARTFDGIGDEIGGARYPAVAFVRWLADEYAAVAEILPQVETLLIEAIERHLPWTWEPAR